VMNTFQTYFYFLFLFLLIFQRFLNNKNNPNLFKNIFTKRRNPKEIVYMMIQVIFWFPHVQAYLKSLVEF
jgi:hypothetical protein